MQQFSPVPVSSLAKHSDVLLCQHVRGVAKVQLEQVGPDDRIDNIKVLIFVMIQVLPGVLLRQVNVDPFLKPKRCDNFLTSASFASLPSSDGSIQLPGNIGCTQDEDPVCIVPNSLE